MLKEYPIFKINLYSPESKTAFNSLSEKNKKAIESFNRECSIKSKSSKRFENRKRALTRFLKFIQKDFDSITYNDYVNTAEAIAKSKLSTYSRNGERDFIKRFLRETYPDYALRFKNFKLLSSEQKEESEKITSENLLTESDIDKMIRATNNMKYKALICTLAESGARPEELLKSRWSDVDFKSGLIHLFSGKTKKKRAVPISVSLSHLERLKEEIGANDSDFVFYSTNKTKKLCVASLNLIISNIAEKAGITKKIYPYLFRHSRLSLLITKLSPKVYEDIAGHSLQIGMKTYAHLSTDKHIQEMNEKVFKVKRLNPEREHELEKKVEVLKDIVNLMMLKEKRYLESKGVKFDTDGNAII